MDVSLLYNIAFAVLVIVAGCFAFFHAYYAWMHGKVADIPGPKASFPVGNTQLLRGPTGRRDLFRVYAELTKEYGRVFKFFLGSRPVIVVSDAEMVRNITVSQFKNFHDRPANAIFGGAHRRKVVTSGILLARGGLWTSLRAACQPAFHTASLQQYSAFMNNAADVLISHLDEQASKGTHFDIQPVLGGLTLRVVFKCAFGVDLPPEGSEANKEVLEAARKMFTVGFGTNWQIVSAMFPAPLQPVIERVGTWLGAARLLDSGRRVLFSVVYQLANQFRRKEGLPEYEVDPRVLGGEYHEYFAKDAVPSEHSILVNCMKAKNKVDGEPLKAYQIMQQGVVFIAAGYETTATTLTFAIFLLSRHPAVQERLLAEIDAVGRDVKPDYDSLSKWPFAKAVVWEALRLYPVAPVVSRLCTQDTTVHDVKFHKDIAVHFNAWTIHRDPAYWDEPNTFKPDRFIANPELASSPQYLAFGGGPRNCIGLRFALEEAVTVLVRTYQRYTFDVSSVQHPDKDLQVKHTFTMAPKNGLWIKANRR